MNRLIVFLLASACCAGAFAANWNDAQQEVWAFVEKSWEDDVGETGKWPGEYVVSSYTSWGGDSPVPVDLAMSEAEERFSSESNETLFNRVQPLSIVIDGDTAVVHYYSVSVQEDAEEDRDREVSAITEVLVKRDGGWKYLSSVGWEPDFD